MAMNGGMQLADMMKMQIIANSNGDFMKIVYLMVFEFVIGYVKILVDFAKRWGDEYFRTRISKAVMEVIPNANPENEIILETFYDTKKVVDKSMDRAGAVLYYISEIPSIRKMMYRADYIINYNEKIEIAPQIQFQLINLEYENDSNSVAHIKFSLTSKRGIQEIRLFVEKCMSDYILICQNKLGSNMYFFDQLTNDKMTGNSNPLPTDKLYFTNMIFRTNRTLNNVFFEQSVELRHRVEFFMKRKDWYDEKGLPWTLGLLLYGAPGCGKTSLIKAIANITGRHIININLGEIKTKTQLKRLFYESELCTMSRKDAMSAYVQEKFNLGIEKRIYVIEDIDAVKDTKLIGRRDSKDDSKMEEEPAKEQYDLDDLDAFHLGRSMRSGGLLSGDPTGNSQMGMGGGMDMMNMMRGGGRGMMDNMVPHPSQQMRNADNDPAARLLGRLKKAPEKDRIDLATLLNVFDGTLETPGRIMIITTNFPEKLDQALIRPGRIDMCIEFKKCNRDIIAQMYKNYYDAKPDVKLLERVEEYVWTPAEISQIFFRFLNSPEESLQFLIDNTPEELFKYSHFDKEY